MLTRLDSLYTELKLKDYTNEDNWKYVTIQIMGDDGKPVFKQENCRFPSDWSDTACNIVGSKYFYGGLEGGKRESDFEQVMNRVADTIANWGVADNYIKAEQVGKFSGILKALIFNQVFAFNSPVWFNLGLYQQYDIYSESTNYTWNKEEKRAVRVSNVYENSQIAACYIQSVDDDMDSIMELAKKEAMLFKYGSGTGTNMSTLRSEKERLSSGGRPSGPLSFMRVYDKVAGVVKSGGVTRRAAILRALNVDHPDIMEFIDCKRLEEEKAKALIEAGYSYEEAYSTVDFQNANISVRITDDFIKAVKSDADWATKWVTDPSKVGPVYKARDIFNKIAENAWLCGDPGLQFHDTVNEYNTCSATNTVHGSNPCLVGSTLIKTEDGLFPIEELVGKTVKILNGNHELSEVTEIFKTGRKSVYRLTTELGFSITLTEDHPIFTANRGDVPAGKLTQYDELVLDWAMLEEMGWTTMGDKPTTIDHLSSFKYVGEEDVYDLTEPVTHHFFANGICVHNCGEFCFIDETSCNLASINLLKFVDWDKKQFNADVFWQVCRIVFVAQDILVDNASYPTRKIAENSHKYRPIGLGYSNLGGLLMSLGIPYDSYAGRTVCSSITAIMQNAALVASQELAGALGPFEAFEANRDTTWEVLHKYKDAAETVLYTSPRDLPYADFVNTLTVEAKTRWRDTVINKSVRNAQFTLLAPCGTIGFMMDCATTGIEPELALTKYKKLIDGGTIKLVNPLVARALTSLEYSQLEIARILEHVEKTGVVDGAKDLKEEHLPVFDCSLSAPNTNRCLSWRSHVDMMAAAQQFVSGGISKCVTGDTLVLTEQGILPIQDLSDQDTPDSFSPLSLEVGSINGAQQTDSFYYGGEREVIRIRLKNGLMITGTPNHRIKVATSNGWDWKRLDTIESNDSIAYQLGTDMWSKQPFKITFKPLSTDSRRKTVRIPEYVDPDFGRLLGYFIAEGNIVGKWCISLSSCREALEDANLLFQRLFGISGEIKEDKRNGSTYLRIISTTLCELFSSLGLSGTAPYKEIPECILKSPKSVVQEFIGGLWLDGYIRKESGISIASASEKLIEQLQIVLMNFGLYCNRCNKWNKDYERYYYVLDLPVQMAEQFKSLYTLNEAHKQAALDELIAKAINKDNNTADVIPYAKDLYSEKLKTIGKIQDYRQLLDSRTKNTSWALAYKIQQEYPLDEYSEIFKNNIHFSPVREITTGECADVYDFHIPSNHAFIGNGLVNHNTISFTSDATIDDIKEAYMYAWEKKLKGITIYRDGSKGLQPLSTGKEAKKEKKAEKVEKSSVVREKLPDTRSAVTHKFDINGHKGYFTLGFYENGKIGEIFVTVAKEGSTIGGLMDALASSVSIGLQYGVPMEDFVRKFSFTRFEPWGWTKNKDIPMAKSIVDYIFRYIDINYLKKDEKTEKVEISVPDMSILGESQSDSPICANCGSITYRNGSCYLCHNCGTSLGCS